MKKVFALSLFLSVLCVAAHAAEPVGDDAVREAHRQEMKSVKAAQREAHKKNAGSPQTGTSSFWHKEAERSGFSRIGNGNWLQNLNPMPFFKSQDEQYKARKAAEQKSK